MAAAKEISARSELSELDGIFKLKEHKNGAEGFSRWTPLFRLVSDWLSKAFIKHQWLAAEWWRDANISRSQNWAVCFKCDRQKVRPFTFQVLHPLSKSLLALYQMEMFNNLWRARLHIALIEPTGIKPDWDFLSLIRHSLTKWLLFPPIHTG